LSIIIKNSQGVYVLVLKVSYSISIKTSRIKWLLQPGVYLYFGSARGKTSTSLEKRLIRHFHTQKTIFWHIDYLTSHSDAKILNAYYTTDPKITECQALQEFVQKFQKMKILPHFGSSDCKSKCGGHLLFVSSNQDMLTEFTKYFRQKDWNKSRFDSNFNKSTTSVLN
jgi:Uri superfamily endonuclease